MAMDHTGQVNSLQHGQLYQADPKKENLQDKIKDLSINILLTMLKRQ